VTLGVMLGHDGPLPMQGAESPVAQGTA
jgi:hypothetical protein